MRRTFELQRPGVTDLEECIDPVVEEPGDPIRLAQRQRLACEDCRGGWLWTVIGDAHRVLISKREKRCDQISARAAR